MPVFPAMYVCICNGITDRAIQQAIADGCRDLDELARHTGCGTTCGCCLPLAADLLAESGRPLLPSRNAIHTSVMAAVPV